MLRWSRDHQSYFELMMAAKASGITLEDFTQWSTRDPDYKDDDGVIARKWKSAPARHCGALMAALKDAGIKVTNKRTGAEVLIWQGIGATVSRVFGVGSFGIQLSRLCLKLPALPPKS
jgi:hypothetical protein